jgi:peptidoglycan/xylan/chitin deacetylase (PgdA/CDA1 family)
MNFLAPCVVFFVLALSQSVICQTPTPTATNISCVGFRLDDIQDWYLREGQLAVMDVFKEMDVPLTIGIIANFLGTDGELISEIQRRLAAQDAKKGFQLELASHGWNHEPFSNFSETEQEMLLGDSAAKIQSLFGRTTDIFVAPYNDWNGDTITALTNKKFKILSSEVDLDPAPYNMVNPIVWHIPIQASTSTETNEDGSGFAPASHQDTLDQIRSQFENYGFAAVLMHPMEFHEFTEVNGTITYGGVNQTQLNELRQLLTALKAEGFVPTSIGGVKRAFAPDVVTTGTTGMIPTTGVMPTTGTLPTTGEKPKGTTGKPHPLTTGEQTRINPSTSGTVSQGTTSQSLPATTGSRTKSSMPTQSTPGTAPTQSPIPPPDHEEVVTATAVGNSPAFSFCIAMILLSRWLF